MSAPVINYLDVNINRESIPILQHINVQVQAGEFVYIIGKVGSGKTTFMKSLYCEVPIEGGEGTILNFSLNTLKAKDIPYLRRKIGIVFQDFQLLTDRSVHKNLEFVLKATGWKAEDSIENRILEVLNQVGMQNKGYKMPHELSGGEQQRVVIARALLNSPEIILADEPTGNLDPETGTQIARLLHEISQKGTAVIMSTHNYAVVQKFQGRLLKCDDGTIKEVILSTSEKK